jgi:hypothetical protein
MAVSTPTLPATGVAVANTTGQDISATVTGGTVQTVVSTPPNASAVTTPSVPASTTPVTNTTGAPVLVSVTGGTVTVVAVNGTTVATATGANVVVPANGTIAITYSVAPTWTWAAAFAGASGNPLSSPSQLQIPPGGSAQVFYTVAPTWTWNDYEEIQEEPGYSQENTGAEGPGYNPITAMPLTPHTAAGQSGLGAGVTN